MLRISRIALPLGHYLFIGGCLVVKGRLRKLWLGRKRLLDREDRELGRKLLLGKELWLGRELWWAIWLRIMVGGRDRRRGKWRRMDKFWLRRRGGGREVSRWRWN